MRTFTAAIAVLSVSSLARAHHSFAAYAVETIDLRGEVVSFEPAGAHTVTTLETRRDDGRIQRWLVLGPPLEELRLRAANLYFPESGDVIGFCATPFKDARIEDTAVAVTETVRGFTLLTPDGEEQVWDPRGKVCQ